MSDLNLNLDDFLPYRLASASNAVSGLIAQEYQKHFALKIPEWRLMAVLGQGNPLTQRQLVELTRLDKVTVNRAAKSLAARGLIDRHAHEVDGRSHHLTLTKEGRSLYRDIVPMALATERRVEKHLTGDERKALMRILAKLMAAIMPPP